MSNPNPFLTLANRQRQEIDAADAQNLERITDAYLLVYSRVQGDIDALALAMEQEEMTLAELERTPQYKRLVRNMTNELERFNTYLETAIGAAALAAIIKGAEHSTALVNAIIGGGFGGLDPNAITPLLDYLRSDGPLYKRLSVLTGEQVDRVVTSIADGVRSGWNPRRIASGIQDAFGGGLTDALRQTRTVQIKSYQDASRANYMASGGIVQGWVWYAHLDGDRTCLSCYAMHGTVHPLEEQLIDHWNGRCVPLPYIPEFGNPVEQTGQAFFDSLPEEQQRALMGQAKHEAYKSGQFEFSALSREVDDNIYGKMRTETPLKDLVQQ